VGDFLTKQQLFDLIGVQEPFRYVDDLLRAGAIRLRPFTAAWGSGTYVEPEYKVLNQAKFDKVVEEARAKEAERRLDQERKQKFDALISDPLVQKMFDGGLK
jgi:hypothetical protein